MVDSDRDRGPRRRDRSRKPKDAYNYDLFVKFVGKIVSAKLNDRDGTLVIGRLRFVSRYEIQIEQVQEATSTDETAWDGSALVITKHSLISLEVKPEVNQRG